jgi:hypothetical protein
LEEKSRRLILFGYEKIPFLKNKRGINQADLPDLCLFSSIFLAFN